MGRKYQPDLFRSLKIKRLENHYFFFFSYKVTLSMTFEVNLLVMECFYLVIYGGSLSGNLSYFRMNEHLFFRL